MEISSGISLFGTGYTEQTNQTRYANAASRYGAEGTGSGGDSYSFSAEALRLAEQMTASRASAVTSEGDQPAPARIGSDKGGSADAAAQDGAFVASGATGAAEAAGEAQGQGGAGGAGGGGGSSDSDSSEDIQEKIAALQSQLQAALSDGDTSKASSLQAQIAALQVQLQSAA